MSQELIILIEGFDEKLIIEYQVNQKDKEHLGVSRKTGVNVEE